MHDRVTKFEYLGTIFHQCGKIQQDVNNRVTKCKRAYYQINQTIFGKKEINPQTKLKVYRTVLEPILLYSSESWPARGRDISKITASEMKCLRRISGKTKRD
jgi:hypothetical protein